MSEFSEDKWEIIKNLAARLQAIRNILDIFDRQIDSQPFANELMPLKRQLQADFENTLDSLLDLIDDDL